MFVPQLLLALAAVEAIARLANCSDLPVLRMHASHLQINKQEVSIIRLARQVLPQNVVFYQANPPAEAHGAVTCNSQPCLTYCTAVAAGLPAFGGAVGGATSSCTYAFETVIDVAPLATLTIEKVKASCCCAHQGAYYDCVTEDNRPANIPNNQGVLAECHPAACRAFCEAHGLRHMGCGIDTMPPSFDASLNVLDDEDYEAWSCNCLRLQHDNDASSFSDAVGGFKVIDRADCVSSERILVGNTQGLYDVNAEVYQICVKQES